MASGGHAQAGVTPAGVAAVLKTEPFTEYFGIEDAPLPLESFGENVMESLLLTPRHARLSTPPYDRGAHPLLTLEQNDCLSGFTLEITGDLRSSRI